MTSDFTPALDLISRDEFAQLSLYAKNDYLQEVAQRFAEARGLDLETLDKTALSRLRRYYSRRVWADLKLSDTKNAELRAILERLGQTIRDSDLRTDVTAALTHSITSKRILRRPPDNDDQLVFFVPAIYDAPIKDDVNLMDVAPFSLGKNKRMGVIEYELKDCLISIEGGAEVGLATVFDYDIFLNMVSHLAEEVRRYRVEEKKGLRPAPPAKNYRPSAAHILKFCRRSTGGRQYEEIENALRRLAKTTITVTNLTSGKRRQVDTRPLIGEYRVISKTSTGKIDEIDISIPDWVWISIVRNDTSLPLLTLNPNYFLISSGLGRFIYRLARKAAGKNTALYSTRELHKRSGTSQDYRRFMHDLRSFIQRTKAFPMPDYDLTLVEGKTGTSLSMIRRAQEEEDEQASLLDAKLTTQPLLS